MVEKLEAVRFPPQVDEEEERVALCYQYNGINISTPGANYNEAYARAVEFLKQMEFAGTIEAELCEVNELGVLFSTGEKILLKVPENNQ